MRSSIKIQANIVIDNTGSSLSIPVIVTRDGVLKSYLEYLVVFRFRSQSWINRSLFSVRLLIDYIDANKTVFDKPRDLFREFANCLYTGTVGENYTDQSELFWKPRKVEDANSLIRYLSHYTDWLANQNDDLSLQLNPFREATKFEQQLNWAAYHQRKHRSFYSHLWNKSDASVGASRVRTVQSRCAPYTQTSFTSAKAFPQERINSLLFNGFVLPGKESCTEFNEKLNLRDVLITLLMHFGGLRISEAIQLYVVDIACLDNSDRTHVVKVHDPAYGVSPKDIKETRREYLWKYFQLRPRNEYPTSSKHFAGWKKPLLTNSSGKFFTVEFFPSNAGELFFDFWRLYLLHQRKHESASATHPYAFTSRDGSPLSIKSYTAARKRAVKRIGLEFSKEACTTAHADRHSYGQRLAACGVPPLVIRTAMHHKSIESQATYTQPSEKDLRRHLQAAEERALKNKNITNLKGSYENV